MPMSSINWSVLTDANAVARLGKEIKRMRLERNLSQAEQALLQPAPNPDLGQAFARQLLASLPLRPYGSSACRQCGLCDLAQQKVAEHLQAPAGCLLQHRA